MAAIFICTEEQEGRMRYSSKLLSLLRGIEHLLSQPGTSLEWKKNTYFFDLNGAICDNNTYTHMHTHTHINALSLFSTIAVFLMAASCLDDFKAQIKLGAHSNFRFSWHFTSWTIWKIGGCMCVSAYIYTYTCVSL